MLQRLYASLARGPGLNARPHNSRQRIDLCDLRALKSTPVETCVRDLFANSSHTVEFPAKVPRFSAPDYPEKEWSEEQKSAARAYEIQQRILTKLRDIAADATDYFNDHGENALYLGFPLISLPAAGKGRDNFQTKNLLAPLLLAPVTLRVRQGSRPGVTIEATGEGGELIIPNPALLAWIEQQTGEDTDDLFADDTGEDPWREISEVLALVGRATGLDLTNLSFGPDTPLQPVTRSGDLPDTATLIPGAVLGLFPITNPGLLRDTKWMIEHEAELKNPVKAFLSPAALSESPQHDLPAAREWDHTGIPNAAVSTGSRSPAQDDSARFLVTHADPCQSEAVSLARHSAALVIHGPPGTGKSQTIANVIGDHLARGERVLFVCDKRTALDVVKYRLDGMDLGGLCGVIHDPSHDRRHLYLALRERLEALPGQEPLVDPSNELAHVNQRIGLLQSELRDAFNRLHAVSPQSTSFHEITGRWLALRAQVSIDLPDIEGLSLELIESHRTDLEEIILRSGPARWSENPFRQRLGMSVGEWLSLEPSKTIDALKLIQEKAARLDALPSSEQLDGYPPVPTLDSSRPLADQANARRILADQLEALKNHQNERLSALGVAYATLVPLHERSTILAAEAATLDKPLDREIALNLGAAIPSLGDVNRRIAALETWSVLSSALQRIFAFSAKKDAREALAPIGQALTAEGVNRAMDFYRSLRARWLWSDFHSQAFGETLEKLLPDSQLISFRDGLPKLFALQNHLQTPSIAGLESPVQSLLPALAAQGAEWISRLRHSADRADAVESLVQAERDSRLFTHAAVEADLHTWLAGSAASENVNRQVQFCDTLDDAIRLTDRFQALPSALAVAVDKIVDHRLDWKSAEPVLRAAALAREIRTRLRTDTTLSRIDTRRVEAAFAELAERTASKQQLVRAHILHRWQKRWRERLIAVTGTRLNTAGASLRQRLFVRGQRALKLRQMIAAGLDAEGGDPLFDLCPVWMASPATVSQIFPKTPLFDVIIFDEASQCRLEEALPVLLRGKRVVIAGDPKQLPPTRFFEQSLAESDDTGAETAEDVFHQQQSESEDLLAAALNLEVQEAFLDVHYRSRNEALIGFSNDAFYSSRLQPIPGHPRNKALRAPIRLVRADGLYENRGNATEARITVELVSELLDSATPPSIGIACFNLNQRDLILDALDERAAKDSVFAERLEIAKKRRGRDSFEGLFVKNLENVQGDERDHMIICTTFGPDKDGKFRRNFGALSRTGGERRLNVLVTRARDAIHVVTSIPRAEYMGGASAPNERPTGRLLLYGYLLYAERLESVYRQWQDDLETARRDADPVCTIAPATHPSSVAQALGQSLHHKHKIGSTVHWGNDGFSVDVALTHPEMPEDVTIGVLTDFNRYRKTPDPIAWELFRMVVLRSQGWELHRLWTPGIFRDPDVQLNMIRQQHDLLLQKQRLAAKQDDINPSRDPIT